MTQEYLQKIFQKFKTGDASERTYYPVLENLLEEFSKNSLRQTSVVIEPRKTKIGIPDFKIKTNKDLLIGYIEAKNLGRDLDNLSKIEEEQLKKYLKEYPKLILTNFIEFRLFENGNKVDSVLITQPITLELKTPVLINEPKLVGMFEKFFSTVIPEVYTSKRLAELLAHKTRVIKDLLIEEINLQDEVKTSTEELLEVFKKTLLHAITPEQFADMYAQTISYGLFVARLNSGVKEFNRSNAFEFIPKTVPLLKRLFHIISGQDLPQHIRWHVEEITEILANTKIDKIKEEFFSESAKRDPIIHFYETFLKEYDPKEREKRGVYYTPEPVVSYIVRSINHLLKEKFGKKDGFADPSVIVLDPAAGTLTFPAKAISVAKEEFSKKYGGGGWKNLVQDHILKNFYAFELLMAPYAIGHLKIGLLLEGLGYKLSENDRFKLFLTNTLEMEKLEQIPMLLAPELSKESEDAYEVKTKTPILVVFGNPPYSGTSENKGSWILEKIKDYKQIEGKSLGERNPKWIQDDYVKFFRFAQWKIEKAEQGILGFITNHAWLDNPTFRGMRYSLMKTFDEIYILNLHGSTLKKEKTPKGGKDENVFDIQTGVAITICIKNKDVDEKKIFYSDLWGLREKKYDWLEKNNIKSSDWQVLNPNDPYYFFVPKEERGKTIYRKFWKITDIFPVNSVGIVTARDNFVIDFDRKNIEERIRIFRDSKDDDDFIKNAYVLEDKPTFRWYIKEARQKLRETQNWEDYFTKILYRPFDERWIYYHSAVIERSRENTMKHMVHDNLALCVGRSGAVTASKNWDIVFASDSITDLNLFRRGGNQFFPLYVYPKTEAQKTIFDGQEKLDLEGTQHSLRDVEERKPNIDEKVIEDLKENFGTEPTPEEIFYYVYAVLYSNVYRQKYQEFLKIDFPRIPFTKNYRLFQRLSDWGEKLVGLHLLKTQPAYRLITQFRGENDSEVKKAEWKMNEIWINDEQRFTPVPEEVWNYYIGGYQVLYKWLKDQRDRRLSLEEIKRFQQIVTSIKATIEIQKEIDKIYPEVEKSLISSRPNSMASRRKR